MLQLKRFNLGVNLKSEVEQKIHDFFQFKWKNEKNQFMTTEEERLIMQ
jgi:hypothetical protein